jgi:hypothetical protein
MGLRGFKWVLLAAVGSGGGTGTPLRKRAGWAA